MKFEIFSEDSSPGRLLETSNEGLQRSVLRGWREKVERFQKTLQIVFFFFTSFFLFTSLKKKSII